MSPLIFEYVLFCVYILAGPIVWVLFGTGMFAGRRRMMLLQRPHSPLRADPPRVTVLVPAKDEGERIRQCLGSILAQDYPNFHVIAVDDRSVDDTGRIMDEIAAAHANLNVIHIRDGELPTGWTGKCNALRTGVGH